MNELKKLNEMLVLCYHTTVAMVWMIWMVPVPSTWYSMVVCTVPAAAGLSITVQYQYVYASSV